MISRGEGGGEEMKGEEGGRGEEEGGGTPTVCIAGCDTYPSNLPEYLEKCLSRSPIEVLSVILVMLC